MLTAISSSNQGSTDPSEPVKITLDQAKPELTITKPADGFKTNQTAVTIEGKVTDLHLSEVTINGQKVNVTEDGSYSCACYSKMEKMNLRSLQRTVLETKLAKESLFTPSLLHLQSQI